ncbi:Na/Pi cotransporter family protein [Shimwellia blattae]|uniref:Inorganic phosphate transporter n=1 Tax=Shimwellia blattae (strain ATCC 29907 / DSM 4481 / JCM 1650 / NBRC 105725 / CDC 9005-74) TaxID=630626 RepID=I2BDY7_SHIBC|nr:Na/Pi cotransporter family protein [Shimwellia blattae]AFJ48741.1 inorganic phosphate transporter [Shimwellia blattae DSM 4481 = NBRC 105725]GAB83168.1 putative PNaS family transporter YjbB [Shimwellia blattae DSM 4481 = NBRC 105725]VDY66227.1 sodium-dependent inorganic phosphate (Pi) transporter [Shimwellia blattae]VEC27419.1 sodium-dependent inorganic phosphate (Pi) transporter [Shimwellia blattae]
MLTLLHLLSAVSLLVWGTHIVRTGVMRVFGARLRSVLSQSVEKKPLAFCAGIGVTALVQSSNATTMLVTSFVAQDLVALTPALVIVLGADVGTALMARVLTFDLSWLSPLLIFIGVIFFLGRRQTRAGQLGRVGIGLGLILLALELIVQAATPITQASGVKVIFASLTGDIMLDALIGAVFAVISYSSLAAVLLTATLNATGVISFDVALCLVIGANLGSGLLAMLNNSTANAAARRVALGSLLFKLVGSLAILPFIHLIGRALHNIALPESELVIYFHVFYNLIRCIVMVPFAEPMARFCRRVIQEPPELDDSLKPKYLDPSALDTPALGLANAARETLRIGDTTEQMLDGLYKIMHGEPRQEKVLRKQAEDINVLYTAIKLYLARMPKDELAEEESRRWAEIIEMSLNLEQASDIVERMGSEIADKSLAARRAFSVEGLKELDVLYEQLLSNLQLAMSVFFSGDVPSARRLRRSKHRFRIMNRRYSHAHVDRLHQQNVQSIETSSLHLGLLGDMKRLNSLFCAVAYSVLEQPDDDDEREADG